MSHPVPVVQKPDYDRFLQAFADAALNDFVTRFRDTFGAGAQIGVWPKGELYADLMAAALREAAASIPVRLELRNEPPFTAIRYTPLWGAHEAATPPYPDLMKWPDNTPPPPKMHTVHEELRFASDTEAFDAALTAYGDHHWVVRETYAPCRELLRIAPRTAA